MSQQHYAALDAYVLVRLVQKLNEKTIEEGLSVDSVIVTLDLKIIKS